MHLTTPDTSSRDIYSITEDYFVTLNGHKLFIGDTIWYYRVYIESDDSENHHAMSSYIHVAMWCGLIPQIKWYYLYEHTAQLIVPILLGRPQKEHSVIPSRWITWKEFIDQPRRDCIFIEGENMLVHCDNVGDYLAEARSKLAYQMVEFQ